MRDRVRRPAPLAGGLIAIAAVLALAGCTGASPTPQRSPTPSPATPTSAAVPARIPNDPSLRADAAMSTCAAASGGWAAGGRVTNRGSKAHDYRLTVLFTDAKATVIGVGETIVHTPAGTTASWTVRARFAAAAPTLCVLSGVA